MLRPDNWCIITTLWIFLTLHFVDNVKALHHQLTESELVQTFGVQKVEHVPEYRLIDTSRDINSRGETQRIRFTAWNSTYVVELQPNERLISPHITSIIRDGNRTEKYQGLPTKAGFDCHFYGRVISHGNLKAAISDCQKLMGVIIHDDHFLMIQTLPERVHHIRKRRHVVYKRKGSLINPLEHFVDLKQFDKNYKRVKRNGKNGDDVTSFKVHMTPNLTEQPVGRARTDPFGVTLNVSYLEALIDAKHEEELEEFCDISKSIDDVTENAFGIDNSLQLNYTLPSEAKLDSLFIFPQLDPITLEIGLFLDSQLYDHFRREFSTDPDQHLTEFSLALINNVHVLYQQPTLSPNLDIVIVRFEMWKTQPPALVTELHKNGYAQTLLDSFCRHQARINPGTDLTDPGHWDHGVLLTGYDIYHTTSSVAGVAPVGRMCDDLFACSLVEGLHLGRSFVLAHEMGHNMGMVHDGVQNQCARSSFLMSAVNGAGKTTWSTCSVREFNAFLLQLDESGRGNCLRDPAESIVSHDHLKDGRLPGQRFTANQQCSYFWGRDYQVEIPNGRSYEDICRILWCGNSGSTISTAHPALEGSWCGGEKWCHEGRCEPWSWSNLPVPKVVDGEWSSWTSAEQQCPIIPCQITGSIALKSQLRTCTNPAPNNGGRSCEGMNVRGLVCGSEKSTCNAFDRQQFGDQLCSAIRDDDLRPDRQLSGISFLHATQPCKIWCHVRDSELIRNKGQFPNGSPCGLNQYCVSGSCLMLSCNNKAVVANDGDCPAAETTKKTSKWDSWSDWSECSATCGDHGVQKRQRKCRSVDSECAGKASEVRTCEPILPKCFEYSEWSEWSKCSARCDNPTGLKRRQRTCIIGDCESQALVEEIECKNEEIFPCQTSEWMQWNEWSSCSVTCGHGQRQRQRECKKSKELSTITKEFGQECEGESSLIESCIEKNCDAPEILKFVSEEIWSEWMPCSVSCGIGFQLREKRCSGRSCPEKGKQARTCNVQDCSKVVSNAVLSEWSLWTACSKTCGQGFEHRHRKCLNAICSPNEVLTEHRRCVLGPCPIWSNWDEWSSECTSCSVFETRKRKRQCVVKVNIDGTERNTEVSQDSCSGAPYELDNCENICLDRERQQAIQDNKDRLFGAPIVPITITGPSISLNTVKFGDNRNENSMSNYLPWQEWTTCSVSCGQGVRQRTRVCPEGKDCLEYGLNFEVGSCFEKTCPTLSQISSFGTNYWDEWSDWSECSVSCGGGQQIRTRKCKIALVFLCNGHSKEERGCNTGSCDNLVFDKTKVPEWSEWSEFSQCSCFTLTRFRRRYCKVLDPIVQGFCTGSVIDQEPCEPISCASTNGGWSDWSEWSQCSRKCGANGHQIRNRMCSNPLPSNRGAYCVGYSFDQRPCDKSNHKPICVGRPVNGGWSDWTNWSECSDPCINGQRSRTRYCSNPIPSDGGTQCFGSDFELEPCSDSKLCASTNNSTTVSKEVSTANTTAIITVLYENSTISPAPPINGRFSEWTPWSDCSEECGFSFRSRQRICNSPRVSYGGNPCNGLAYTTSICRKPLCHNYVDGQWSSWSSWREFNCHTNCTNVEGIRIRTRECTSPSPLKGGLPCFGRSVETLKCTGIHNTQTSKLTVEKNELLCNMVKKMVDSENVKQF